MMVSSSSSRLIASLSRRLAQTSLKSSSLLPSTTTTTTTTTNAPKALSLFASSNITNNNNVFVAVRGMSKMSKRASLSASKHNEQHETWVDFQKAIKVDGFETGQTTKVVNMSKRNRGGKLARKKRERELAASREKNRAMNADLGGGQYPPLRYSEEETARLLKEAYENIPKRDGKRGTRHLKRQRVRWFRVRRAHRKVKQQKIQTHFRRMAERSQRVKDVLAVKASAPEVRQREADYQQYVLNRWAQNMGLTSVPSPVVNEGQLEQNTTVTAVQVEK